MSEMIQVSMVADAYATETKPVQLLTLLQEIKNGRWKLRQDVIRKKREKKLRETGGDLKAAKEEIKKAKEALPAVTFAGLFSYRENDCWESPSGLLPADLDNLDSDLPAVREKLRTSPHLFFDSESVTGSGLRAVFRIPIGTRPDEDRYHACFEAVRQHVLDLCGVEIDPSCKDPVRLSFVCADRNARWNLEATPIALLPVAPQKAKAAASTSRAHEPLTKEQVRDMLRFIPKRPDYADWIRVVAGVGDALPDDEAIEVLNEWSEEEEKGEYAAKLRKRLKDITVGTLIHLAQQHGWHDENATIARLAALSLIEYDRIRKAEADKLGCRESTLDSLVQAKRLLTRPASDCDNLQGNAVDFLDVSSYETSVNGEQVLDEVAATFRRYLVLPTGAADTLALWVLLTHCFEAFEHVARLNCCSPDKQCGKTTTLDVTACFVARPLRAENITTAVLFRLVEKYKPTLLLDEVDTYVNEKNGELRGCLNAGHKRGGKAYRCEGQDNTVRSFTVFAPAALAGIGALPGTLHDRSIVIKLARAKAGEIAARFDSRRVHYETELCRKLSRWSDDNIEKLKICDPQLPETAFNRLADNWRPLFAIAEIAGGDWPQRTHAAFVALTSSADLDAQGVGTLLLSDIAAIFAERSCEQLPSAELVESLVAIEGRPWAEWGKHRKPISPNQLANQLKRFGVTPKSIKFGDKTLRGYYLSDFNEAFSRYLPDNSSTECNSATTLGESPLSEVQPDIERLHPENDLLQRESCTVAPCTDGEPGKGDKVI